MKMVIISTCSILGTAIMVNQCAFYSKSLDFAIEGTIM
jgi:hypothetical protein